MSKKSRNITLDILKGVCIILMVAGHSGAPELLHNSIYLFHMPCFFIISGYLFKDKYLNNLKEFFKRRGLSLWKPFVLWGFIFLCLHNIFAYLYIYDYSYSFREYIVSGIKTLYMRKAEPLLGGFWFLTSLLIASIVSILFYRYISFKSKGIFYGLIFFLLLGIVLCYFSINRVYLSDTNMLAIAYFMTGTLLSRMKIPNNYWRYLVIVGAIIILGIGCVYLPYSMLSLKWEFIIPYYISSVVISYALLIVCFMVKDYKGFDYIAEIGNRTMDILIFHFLVFKVVSLVKIYHYSYPVSKLSEFPVIAENNEWYWLVYTVVGVVGSLLCAKLIDILINIFCRKLH